MKKVLIVTYYWPPAGGPGVQRVLKFVKYLPLYGWQPVILTVKKGVYPALDFSLFSDIDENIKVFFSKNPEPDKLYRKFTQSTTITPVSVLASKEISWQKRIAHNIRLNYFIPDAKKFWRPFGFRIGKNIIRQEKPDIIFSSSPPPTTHLIAMDLAQWSSIPWIADFRDPWSKIHYYNTGRHKKAQLKDEKLEISVINKCNKLICVSEKFSELLAINDRRKLSIIHNGYDSEDFSETKKRNNKFQITYIGGLTINRFYHDFFRTIKKLVTTNKIDRKKIELCFAGSINQELKQKLETLFQGLNILKFHNYLPHSTAIELMQNSDLLLLFNEKVPDYQGHLPGKLFEYLASNQQILGIGDVDGEASDIIRKCHAGNVIDAQKDPSELILKHYNNWQGGQRIQSNLLEIAKFDRKKLTGHLAKLFTKTIKSDAY